LKAKLDGRVEVCVWVPCHITCFFEIKRHDNPLETGSRGAGLNLDLGVRTRVVLDDSDDVEVIGGNVVSRDVAERMLRGLGVKAKVEISHESPVPMGVGYGVSGATALGSAIAISAALGNVMTILQAGSVAHVAEVEHMTGLGDVIAQIHGGVEIRVKEGAPGIGVVDWIPYWPGLRVIAATIREISTQEMLKREEVINKEGYRAFAMLIKRPCIEVLMEEARRFADAVGFIDEELREVISAIPSSKVIGASVKKGVLYALASEDEAHEVYDIVREHLKGKQVLLCGISPSGPKITLLRRG